MRKCGTCRHFSDCGIAGSGNCLHNHRKHLFQIVLVRRTELACRNAFDQDLWEPVPSAESDAAQGANGYRPLPPADASSSLFVGGEETRPAPGLGLPGRMHLRAGRSDDAVDDVAAHGTTASGALQSQETGVIAEHPGGAVVREARRRRQALHQQERLQEFEARTGVRLHDTARTVSPPTPAQAPVTRPTPPTTVDVPQRIDAGGTLPAAGAREPLPTPDISVEFSGRRMPAEQASASQREHTPQMRTHEDSAHAAPVPQRREEPRHSPDSPSARPVQREMRNTARTQRESPPLPSVPRRRQVAPPVDSSPPQAPRVRPTRQQANPGNAGRSGDRHAAQPTEQFETVTPVDAQSAGNTSAPLPRRSPEQRAAARPAPLPVPESRRGRAHEDTPNRAQTRAQYREPVQSDWHLPLTGSAHDDQPSEVPLALPRRRQAASDLAPARAQDPIELSQRCAGIPRCCGTCVSFQRMEGTNRGRCHNVHVFTVPNVVDADTMACKSSMGTWWLPASGAAARYAGAAPVIEDPRRHEG